MSKAIWVGLITIGAAMLAGSYFKQGDYWGAIPALMMAIGVFGEYATENKNG